MAGGAGAWRFATTQWSLVLRAADRSAPASEAALATLCEAYWRPVYAFVRRSGYNGDDARDLTQAFFARLLEKQFLKEAAPHRGRFRSFLLTSVRNFLANEYDREHALKRGGTGTRLSLEFVDEEGRYQVEPPDLETPEQLYERRWARDVFQTALERLSAAQTPASHLLFERLKPFLTGDGDVPLKSLAGELAMTDGALRVAMHRLRRQYGSMLRAVVGETVERPEEVEEELRHLLKVIS